MIKRSLKLANKRAAALAHYAQLARIGKALGSQTRLRLLDLLRQGPRSVEALAGLAGLTVPNASQHLQELRRAGLLIATRRGHFVEYRLAAEDVSRLFAGLRELAEAVLPEMDRVRAELGVLDEERRAELLRRIRKREVTLLDVRPEEEFRAGHLPGARSLPLEQLSRRLPEIPREREVIAYCRGPYCTMAAEAVELLRRAGYRANPLDLGAPDLGARGLFLEVVNSEPPEGKR